MPARKILVVDDDDILRDSLVEQLSLYEEFDIEHEATAAKGVQRARARADVDLVVMDVGLPDMDGREAVKLLRKGGFKAPVIMLTGQDSESDTILGLEAGANDYVTKPFRFAVLLARIRAQLRQHEQSEDAVFTIGRYTFRPSAKMLVDERGQKVRLTEKETAILKYLYRAGEKVITRDVLLHEVWGYNSGVTTHTLETHIYRLRQKIERDPSKAGAPGHRCRRLQAGPLMATAPLRSADEPRPRHRASSRIPLFSELSTEQLRLLAFSAVRLELVGKQVLFREGREGAVGLMSWRPAASSCRVGEAPRKVVAICEAGSLIGEIALFIETKRPATATAASASQVLEIDRKLVTRMLNEYPHVALRLRATLSERLTATVVDLGKVRQALADIPSGRR